MKKLFYTVLMVLGGLNAARSQNADPYLDLSLVSPVVQIGVSTTLQVLTGNAGNDAIVANSLRVTVSVGTNAQITGVGVGSDPRWVVESLTAGTNNTIRLTNAGGDFGSFDLDNILLTVKGTVLGGPSNITGNVDYIPGPNVLLGGFPSATQGDANNANNNGTTSMTVTLSLPLNFVGFDVKEDGCGSIVSWKTASEQNVSFFEVQQSFDGVNYTTIKKVNSQGDGAHTYTIKAEQAQKRMFYRIIGVDLDNRKSYSSVQALQFSGCTKAAIVQVFPIPAFRDQKVTMQSNVNDKITYRVMDMSGKAVLTGVFVRNGQLGLLNSGTYLVEMTSATFKESQTIIIQ